MLLILGLPISLSGPLTNLLAGTVDLRIPAGSQSGRKLRLKGRGLPGAHPGDQLVELSIRAPLADTDAQKKAYEALREEFGDYDPRR